MDASLMKVALIVVGVIAICLALAWLLTLGNPRRNRWFGALFCNKTAIAQPEPTDEQHRTAEETYWRQSVKEQRKLTWFTVIASVVGIGGLIVLWRTLALNRRQLDLSARPWVSIRVSTFGPSVPDTGNNGVGIPLEFDLANHGHSVAEQVQVIEDVYPVTPPRHRDNPVPEQQALCQPYRTKQTASKFARLFPLGYESFPLFPEETVSRRIILMLPHEQIENTRHWWQSRPGFPMPVPPEFLDLWLIGCVNYTYPLAVPNYHQTGFIYNVLARRDGGAGEIDPSKPSALALIDFIYGFYAD